MVWKTAKFGLNTGNTQRRTPFFTYGRNKSCSIRKLGSDAEAAIEKLEECIDNSKDFDPFLAEVFLQAVENLMNFFESDLEYALDKQNRWEFVDMIEQELRVLKSFEEEIQSKLGGENPRFDHAPDSVFGPTEVEINLEIYNLDETFLSKLSFSTIKASDFSSVDSDEVQWDNVYNNPVRGLQRKDQGKGKVPSAASRSKRVIPGSSFVCTYHVVTENYSNKQFSIQTGHGRNSEVDNDSGKARKKEKGQKSKYAYHWEGISPDEINDIIDEELTRDLKRRRAFAQRMRNENHRANIDANRKAKLQRKLDFKKAKSDEKQARKAVRKELQERNLSEQEVVIPLWQILHREGSTTGSKIECVSCEDSSCTAAAAVAAAETLTPRPPPVKHSVHLPFAPHPPTCPRISPENRTEAFILNPAKNQTRVTVQEPKLEPETSKPKKKNRPGQRQRRKEKRKQERSLPEQSKTETLASSQEKLTLEKRNTQAGMATLSVNPLFVKLKTSCLQLPSLRKTFGNGLNTSRTYPRRFVIDLSSSVRQFLAEFVDFDAKPFAEPSLVVTVEVVADDKMEGRSLQYSFVWLNLKCDLEAEGQLLLQKEVESKVKAEVMYSMSKVTDIIVHAFTHLPSQCFSRGLPSRLATPCESAPEKQLARLDWLHALMDWDIRVLSPAQAYKHFAKQLGPLSPCRTPSLTTLSSSSTIISSNNIRQQQEQYQACSVCLSVVGRPSSSTLTRNTATASTTVSLVVMSACGHVICADCLHGNVLRQLEKKEVPIRCPALECEVELDRGTLLCELSIEQFKRYEQHRHNVLIEQHPQWTWCPNKRCRRAIKLCGRGLLEGAVTVVCLCGQDWCFHCYHGNHWPATCQQAEVYRTQQRNWREDSEPTKEPLLRRIMCTSCVDKQKTSRATGVTPGGENCNCLYKLCSTCNNVPKDLLPEETRNCSQPIPMAAVSSPLSRLAYITRARHHYSSRLTWNPALAQLNAAALAKLVQRGNRRPRHSLDVLTPPTASKQLVAASQPIKHSHPGHVTPHRPIRDHHPDNSPRPITAQLPSQVTLSEPMKSLRRGQQRSVQLGPVVQMENLFLVLAHNFLLEVHTLLEYVYVVLMQSTADTDALLPLVLRLETTAAQMKQILYQPRLSPASILPRLQRHHDNGKSIMAAVAKHFSCHSNSGPLAMPLPPMLQDSEVSEEPRVSSARRGSWIGNGKKVLPSIGSR